MNKNWNRGKSDCPCRECGDREIGCHGKCEKYQEWNAQRDKIREARFAQNESMFIVNRARLRKHWKEMKYRHGKITGRE